MRQRLLSYATRQVPRYTSYPTAPHFDDAVDAATYAGWLDALPGDAVLSLYLHVPFCRSMCFYCGCHTKVTRREEPVRAYGETLMRELELAIGRLGGGRPLSHWHWGGGTPTMLPGDLFVALSDRIRDAFTLTPDAEHAVEIDPRGLDAGLVATLTRAGVNRVSLGVQDFTPKVQEAIGRVQSYGLVADGVEMLRAAGIGRINFDLMYGLPHQTLADIERTIDLAAGLAPDRIALFGYAHVPWFKTHQRLIDDAALPGASARLEQAAAAAARLARNGYVAIGIDHFAKADDALVAAQASGTLRRNFQGYTTDSADALVALGASSIGTLPQGFVQNHPDIGGWRRAIEAGRFATLRGKAIDDDDRLGAAIIERLMCDFRVDVGALAARFDAGLERFEDAFAEVDTLARDGLCSRDGAVVTVTPEARPFVRVVAAAFDAYLAAARARHSVAV